MSWDALWLWAPLIMGGLVGAAHGLRRLHAWASRRSLAGRLEKTPLRAIADLPRGIEMVAVQGRARPLDVVPSPIFGEPAIAFRVRIDFSVAVSKTRREPRIIDVTQCRQFEVVDATGKALVKPDEAIFLGLPRRRAPAEFAVDLTRPELERLIQLNGFSTTDLIAANDVKVTERVLRPDGLVYVCGTAETFASASGVGSDYRHPPTRVALSSLRARLVVADCHRDLLLLTLLERSR